MIHLAGVSLQRGTRPLLSHVDLRIHPGERVGIIGANGCGKSSLFALLRGILHADTGELSVPRDWRIAAMEQEVAATDRAALDFVLDGDTEYREIEDALTTASDETIGELYARFAEIDGYRAPARAHEMLDGLGFSPEARMRPVREFSGGWRLRLALARTLMCPSQLMLLDEPTNHLDLDALVWLESWLLRYSGTLLLISHDRDFLDNVITRAVVFSGASLQSYRGNYSAYEHQHAEFLANQQSAYVKQQTRIQEIEGFVARFRAKASKARQAQSRLKELERMARIAPAHIDSGFHLNLPCADRVSTPLLNFERATLGHDTHPILGRIEFSLFPAQRIGLLGPNGAGKSTLIKSIAGDLPLLSGERHTGEHLHIGYFAQHQLEALDLDATPALHVQRLSPNAREQQIRDFLGGYGFVGDKAMQNCGSFSGGEQARLALALIAWQRPNLLLLDEPTNHLDLEMRQALTEALQEYEGAVVLVSHDRHLLRNTVDEFWLVVDGAVQGFDGDLEDYQKLISKRRQAPTSPQLAAAERTTDKPDRKAQARKRESLRPLRTRVESLEKEIERHQAALRDTDHSLMDSTTYDGSNSARVEDLLKHQARLREQIHAAESNWLMACEELERREQTNDEE